MKIFFVKVVFPVWAVIVAGFWFVSHKGYFQPINPELGRSLANLISFNIVLLLVFAVPVFSWWLLKYLWPELGKFKLKIWHGLAFFMLFVLLAILTHHVWDDIRIYEGPHLVQRGEEVVFETENFLEDDVVLLSPGNPLMNPQEDYAYAWSSLEPYMMKSSLLKASWSSLSYLGRHFVFILGLLLAFYAIGWRILRWGRVKLKLIDDISFSIGMGTLVASLGLFALAKLSLLTVGPVLGLLGLFLVLGYKGVFELFKTLNKPSIYLKDVTIWHGLLVLGFFAIVGLNFIEASNPFPENHDDLILYLNLPNLLADRGSWIYQSTSYAFGLIQSLGPLLGQAISYTKVLGFGFGVLILLPAYSFLRHYFSTKNVWLGLLILMFIPFIYMHNYVQIKVELPLLFFGILSLLGLQLYLSNKYNKKFLILAGLMAGFALSIKISSVFLLLTMMFLLFVHFFRVYGAVFMIGIGLLFSYGFGFGVSQFEVGWWFLVISVVITILGLAGVIYDLWHNKKISKTVLLALIILPSTCLLPFLPWGAQNLIGNPLGWGVKSFLYDYTPSPLALDWEQYDITTCDSLGGAEADYNFYVEDHESKWAHILLFPWDFTINTSARIILVNIGFLFLALCPILLLGVKKDHRLFLWGGIYFWLLWGINGNGVLWYGITGFILLIFLLLAAFDNYEKSSKTRLFLYCFIGLWLISSFYIRGNLYLSRSHTFMPYLTGQATYEEFIAYSYPSIPLLTEEFNEKDLSSTFYTNGATRFMYFLENNDQRIYYDQHSDLLYCLYQEQDQNLFVERLKKSGFDYLLLSEPVHHEGFPIELFEFEQEILTIVQDNFPSSGYFNEIYMFNIPSL